MQVETFIPASMPAATSCSTRSSCRNVFKAGRGYCRVASPEDGSGGTSLNLRGATSAVASTGVSVSCLGFLPRGLFPMTSDAWDAAVFEGLDITTGGDGGRLSGDSGMEAAVSMTPKNTHR